MARKRQYDEDFKKNAVELLIKTKKSITQISKDLGISVNHCKPPSNYWKKKYLTINRLKMMHFKRKWIVLKKN